MWNLSAMRSLDEGDPIGGLGPRVEKAPETKPATPEPVGVYTDADGKMRTNLPLPEGPETAPVWPFPTQPAGDVPEPGAHGFMREPLKVGDRVRLLKPCFAIGERVGSVLEVVEISKPDWLELRGTATHTWAFDPTLKDRLDCWERA